MDEVLTRWATDMSRYSKEFKDQAETIARWDQIIVDNSSKIDKLYVRTRTCERQTMSVDMQLAAVENQQSELESWLTKYETDIDEMLAKDSATQTELGGPDQERERTYKLAERLGEKLDEMERDLGSMVEEVNAANASLSKNGKADEPVSISYGNYRATRLIICRLPRSSKSSTRILCNYRPLIRAQLLCNKKWLQHRRRLVILGT